MTLTYLLTFQTLFGSIIKIIIAFFPRDVRRRGNQHDDSVHCHLLIPHGDDRGILTDKTETELDSQRVGRLDDILDHVASGREGAQEDEGVDADLAELGAALCCLQGQGLRIQNEARGAKCGELDGGGGSGFRNHYLEALHPS